MTFSPSGVSCEGHKHPVSRLPACDSGNKNKHTVTHEGEECLPFFPVVLISDFIVVSLVKQKVRVLVWMLGKKCHV